MIQDMLRGKQPEPRKTMASRPVLGIALDYHLPPGLVDALARRNRLGCEHYGTELNTHNGRSARQDMAEELLDALMYAFQAFGEANDAIALPDVYILKHIIGELQTLLALVELTGEHGEFQGMKGHF